MEALPNVYMSKRSIRICISIAISPILHPLLASPGDALPVGFIFPCIGICVGVCVGGIHSPIAPAVDTDSWGSVIDAGCTTSGGVLLICVMLLVSSRKLSLSGVSVWHHELDLGKLTAKGTPLDHLCKPAVEDRGLSS